MVKTELQKCFLDLLKEVRSFNFWVTATMTATHLCFAILLTCYFVIGILYEEKDRVKEFGQKHINYKKTIPMPFTIRKKRFENERLVELMETVLE